MADKEAPKSTDAAPAPQVSTLPTQVTVAEIKRENMNYWRQNIDDVTVPGKP